MEPPKENCMSSRMSKKITLNNCSMLRSSNTNASANVRLARNITNVNLKVVKRFAMREETLSKKIRLCNKINIANIGRTANLRGAIC